MHVSVDEMSLHTNSSLRVSDNGGLFWRTMGTLANVLGARVRACQRICVISKFAASDRMCVRRYKQDDLGSRQIDVWIGLPHFLTFTAPFRTTSQRYLCRQRNIEMLGDRLDDRLDEGIMVSRLSRSKEGLRLEDISLDPHVLPPLCLITCRNVPVRH